MRPCTRLKDTNFCPESPGCLIKTQNLGPSQTYSIQIPKERKGLAICAFNLCPRECLGKAVLENGRGDNRQGEGGVDEASLEKGRAM